MNTMQGESFYKHSRKLETKGTTMEFFQNLFLILRSEVLKAMENLRERDSDKYEDYCFMCKEGGVLLMCDDSDCLKAYHTSCVSINDKCIPERWICDMHSCFICDRSSEFNCLCCTKALCRQCIARVDFVHIRKKYGLCSFCLKVALRAEQNMDVNSDMGCIHFRNYWKIVKGKESLTLENLRSADVRMKSGQRYISGCDSDEHEKHVKIKMLSEFYSTDGGKASSVKKMKGSVKLERKTGSVQEGITKHSGGVAYGEGARVPNQHSAYQDDSEMIIESEDILNDHEGEESSRPNLLPLVNYKRKRSGAENVLESLEGVMGVLSCTDNLAETEDLTLAQALNILDVMAEEMEEINPLTSLYHFAQRFLLDKDKRTIFLKARMNQIRLASLQYNYRMDLRNGGI